MAARDELERDIRDLADLFGWRLHHSRLAGLDRDGGPDGFPTDALVGNGRLVFLTLAAAGAKPTARERAWIDDLASARSVEAYVVTTPASAARVLRPSETDGGAAT